MIKKCLNSYSQKSFIKTQVMQATTLVIPRKHICLQLAFWYSAPNCAMLHNTDSGSSFAHEPVSWQWKQKATTRRQFVRQADVQIWQAGTQNVALFEGYWKTPYQIHMLFVVKWDWKDIHSVNWNICSNDLHQSCNPSFIWSQWQKHVHLCADYVCTGSRCAQTYRCIQRLIYMLFNLFKNINALGPT
jgi:hypothetical protein